MKRAALPQWAVLHECHSQILLSATKLDTRSPRELSVPTDLCTAFFVYQSRQVDTESWHKYLFFAISHLIKLMNPLVITEFYENMGMSLLDEAKKKIEND